MSVGRISEAPSDTVKYLANYYQHFMLWSGGECQQQILPFKAFSGTAKPPLQSLRFKLKSQ